MNRSLVIFAIGALLALAASSLVRAQAPVARTRFEHWCTVVPAGLTETANKAGAEGWELVSSAAYAGVPPGEMGLARQQFLLCFKRPA